MDPSYFRLNGRNISFPVEFEAAVQDDTFYVKELTDLWNPTSPPSAARIEISGASQTDFWAMQGLNVALADKNLAVSGRNTAPEIQAQGKRRFLEDILNLGIEGLQRETLEWTGEHDFRALGRRPGATMQGYLVPGDAGRPQGLVYVYKEAQSAGITCRVHYAYVRTNLPPWMPSRIIRQIEFGSGNIQQVTNEILECGLGTEDLPAGGYTPGRFVTNAAWTNLAVMVFSNNVGWLHQGGKLTRTVLPSEAWRVHPSKHKWVRLGFFGLVAVVVLFCSLVYARSRLRHQDRT